MKVAAAMSLLSAMVGQQVEKSWTSTRMGGDTGVGVARGVARVVLVEGVLEEDDAEDKSFISQLLLLQFPLRSIEEVAAKKRDMTSTVDFL